MGNDAKIHSRCRSENRSSRKIMARNATKGETADGQEEFDKGPGFWASIMKASPKVRDTLTNRTTIGHQESGRKCTIEERNWTRQAKDQRIVSFGQKNVAKTRNISLRPNEDRRRC
jgi:hypothetical protein